MLKFTTEYRGKWRHSGIHDNDWTFEGDNRTTKELEKLCGAAGLGRGTANHKNVNYVPYHQNRLHLIMSGGMISPFFMGDYKEFLKTQEWRYERDFHIKLWDGKCYIYQKRKSVHVHHQTYEFGWLPQAEAHPPYPLIPVCEICHMLEHIKMVK